jgi:hypothetical protein
MSVIDIALHNAIKFLVMFTILPPAIMILPLLVIGTLFVENFYEYSLKLLAVALPPITLFTSVKVWLWWSTYIAPLKKISRAINILKSSGYLIDDNRFNVVSGDTTIIEAENCSEIPKNAMYTVATISRGKWMELVGTMDEQRRVYSLLNVSIDVCRGY